MRFMNCKRIRLFVSVCSDIAVLFSLFTFLLFVGHMKPSGRPGRRNGSADPANYNTSIHDLGLRILNGSLSVRSCLSVCLSVGLAVCLSVDVKAMPNRPSRWNRATDQNRQTSQCIKSVRWIRLYSLFPCRRSNIQVSTGWFSNNTLITECVIR